MRFGGYWMTLALVFSVGFFFFRFWGHRLRRVFSNWRFHAWGWGIAILGGVVWQVNEPRRFKVLFDEHAYVGIAQTMHYQREAAFPGRAHYFDGEMHRLNYGVDKRPVLFPFLVSVVHDLTGFRKKNVFYLNAALGVCSLLLVYHLLLRISNRKLAIGGQILWFGLPLLAQIATGGGYDLLNICLLSSWLLFALLYVESSGDEGDEIVMVGMSVALAQVRNESALYMVATALIIWWKWLRSGRCQLSWQSVYLTAFLIMPVAANVVFSRVKGVLETAPGQDFFSLVYLPDNLAHVVAFVFSPDLESLNSSTLGYAGVICLLLFLVNYIKQGVVNAGVHCDEEKTLFVFAGSVFISFIIYMCMFWGAWTDPMVSRFSLPVWLLFLVMTARILGKISWGANPPSWACLALIVWVFSTSIPASARAVATRVVITNTERLFLEETLNRQKRGDILLIVQSSINSVVDGHAATTVDIANSEPWRIQAAIELGLYKEIWVAERYYYTYSTDLWQREEKYALIVDYEQETFASMKLGNNAEFRISRIIAARDPEVARQKVAEALTPRPTSRLEYFKRMLPLLP